MRSAEELWAEIHRLFEYHRKSSDPDAQTAMERVAMKCTGPSERRPFNSTNCTVSEMTLTPSQLAELVIYHPRSEPKRMEGPIVVLRVDGRTFAIDGNTRANAWKAGKYPEPFTAIIVVGRSTRSLGGTASGAPMPLSSVRPAVSEDAAGVRACVAAAFAHYIERIGKPPAPMLLDFEAEIQARHVWLLSDEEGVVGALVQYETDLGFYIDTVAVVPSSQGTGVGRALLEFAEQEALRRGYQSIHLCTNSKMTENQVFYPRIGYVEYERKTEAGYDRVFYRKHLAAAQGHGAA